MPNGHGGSLRFLSVGIILFFLAAVFAAHHKSGESWLLYAGYALSAFWGERFAFHLHRWKYEEYDGAYYSDETKAGVRKLYIIAAVLYMIGAVVAWDLLTTP